MSSERVDAVFDYVKAFCDEHGYAPTTVQIAEAVGIRSRATVHKDLVTLRDAGRIAWEPNATRTMRVLSG